MIAITRSVMTARNIGADTYAATDRQLAWSAAARFMLAEAPAQTAGWWREFEADLQAAERAIARQHQAAIDAGEPWPPQRTPEPNPSSAPEPDAGPTSKANPEVEPAPAKPEQDDRSARLDELLARADQAARHLAAQQAERQASSEYAARIEREAQAQPEAGRQAETRDQAEIEM